MPPLYQRTNWANFAVRMRRAIAIDIAILIGDATRADLLSIQVTRPLPRIEYNAATERVACCRNNDERTMVDLALAARVDPNATEPMELVVR